jgi:hypothetical protein
MNPLELLDKKIMEIGIPPVYMSYVDLPSLLSHIGHPEAIKEDLFYQLVYEGGMDVNMAQSIINKLDINNFTEELDELQPKNIHKPKKTLWWWLFGG